MAIVNRNLGERQQRSVFSTTIESTVTGQTYVLFNVPFQSQLIAMTQSVTGLSGAPNHSIWLTRFIVGTGTTTMAIGASQVVTDYGTSGMLSFSLALNATLGFSLLSGDVICLSTAAANTAVASATINIVIRDLQDVASHYGV
jgi:hypothetical protein